MIEFRVAKQSKKSRARLGVLTTPHGEIETPAFVGVATQAAVKALLMPEALATGTGLLICNTFHLHLKPGERIVKARGGLHEFMGWPKPLMTDSGGFQVFSLGFGRDLGVGKIMERAAPRVVRKESQPSSLTISDEGVWFSSPVNGDKIFIGPKESIRIQESLGADIMFAFDECTPPLADRAYTKASLGRTHRWAEACLAARRGRSALYGIAQGGSYRDLRTESARFVGALPFDGFGIGGEFGGDKRRMAGMIRAVVAELPEGKPRHLLGIGHPDDILRIVAEGVDTFDCIAPTHYARHGTAFTSRGKLDMGKTAHLRDKRPLDPRCSCFVCATHTRSYIAHLVRAREISGLSLLAFHNLFFFNALVARAREGIRRGKV